MKKLALSFFTILIFTLYILLMNGQNTERVFTTNTPAATTSQGVADPPPVRSKPSRTSGGTASAAPPPAPVPKPAGLYKDGSYVGAAADAFYGTVQVQATVSNGRIVDVGFLQYPNDREHSLLINEQAMPYLKQEAIQAQSANVDIVSGATDTSEAFRASLASALSQART